MDETQPGPKTSVLIVSYNCEAALRRCVEALERSAAREAIEILVVDNGSRDGSGSLDEDFPDVTVLRLPRNFGLTKARNIGVRTAKGDFLLLLEADTEVQPETVASLASRLEADAGAVAVCPLLVDSAGNPVSVTSPLPSPEDLYCAWRDGDSSETLPLDPHADAIAVECPDRRAVLVRSRFVRGMNYFDERYGSFGPDLELFYQARRASKKILLLPGVRAVSRSGEGLWRPSDPSARALISADHGLGAIAYTGKHYGWAAGTKLRLRMLVRAMLRLLWALLRMRDASYRLGVFTGLAGGQRIDGSQQGL